MEIIRRNTDYAFRLAAGLAQKYNNLASVRELSEQMKVPYQLACKLLQKLAAADLVESEMGPKGGYRLAKSPDKISFKQVIEAIQGTVSLNMCIKEDFFCPLKDKCPMNEHLVKLQEQMDKHLSEKTLALLVDKDTNEINKE